MTNRETGLCNGIIHFASVAAGTIGAIVAAETATIGDLADTAAAEVATTIGIESATATILGTIAAGGTALNVSIAEAGKSLATND